MNQTQARAAGIVLIVSAVALGITGLSLAKRPPRFEAIATVKVERDKVDVPELTNVPQLAAGADNSYFIQTEIAVLQSEATLDKVVTRLDLNQVWGKRLNDGQAFQSSHTLQLLKDRLQAQPGSEPTLITIRVASDEAAEAAAIANATAQAYCEYRADYRRRLTQNALDAIAGKYAEMEENIVVARQKVQQAGQQLDPALREQAAATSPADESDKMRALRSRYSESVLRYLAQSNQLALYRSPVSGVDENVEQLNARAEKAKAEMLAAENATREEMTNRELLQNYRNARFELDELNQLFAPLKETIESLQNELRPQEHAPAQVVEQASVPAIPDPREAARGRMLLISGGVTLLFGLGFLVFGRKSESSLG